MKTFAIAVVLLCAAVVLADVVIKNQGTTQGPVISLNCVGSRIACSRSGSAGTITVAACATCDAGYALAADGGCAPQGPPCSPDVGLLSDGGCACSAPTAAISLCAALDGGELDGGWWCMNGDQTMLAGSSVAFISTGCSSPDIRTATWPVLPVGTTETMTIINDRDGGSANWLCRIATDGGHPSPTKAFSTCALFETGDRNQLALSPLGTGCLSGLVGFISQDAGYAWSMLSQGTCANGDTTGCVSAFSTACTGSSNNVLVSPRQMALHCATFLPGDGGANTGSTKTCTTLQGAGTVCSTVTHNKPSINSTASGAWEIGGNGVVTNRISGILRGAFMTDGKALSIAEQTRLGAMTMPTGIPVGMTFTRTTDEECCSGGQCVVLPPNVPCLPILPDATASNQALLNLAAFTETTQVFLTAGSNADGGSMNPIATTEDAIGPYGMYTAIKYRFMAVTPPTQDSGLRTGCSGLLPGLRRCSFWATGNPVDMCVENSVKASSACSVCTPNATIPTYCSVTGYADSTSDQCLIGHLGRYGPLPNTWNDASTWITDVQCAGNIYATDYSRLGTTVNREPQTHTSTSCAP